MCNNVADISEHRLKVAKDMGADYTVHVDTRDSQALAETVKSTLGCEPDITIECSGAESSIQTGIYVSRNKMTCIYRIPSNYSTGGLDVF